MLKVYLHTNLYLTDKKNIKLTVLFHQLNLSLYGDRIIKMFLATSICI